MTTRRASVDRRSVLAGGAAALAGCTRRRDPAALSFWAMSYEGDYAPLLMPAFTRATGLAVEVQSLPATAAHQKLLTALAGASLPDVVMVPEGWVGEFALVGALAPLADPRLLDDLFPGAAATVLHAGRPYAVPWAASPQVQFFRRDLLAAVDYPAPPERWGEWRALAFKLKRRFPDRWPILSLLNWWDTLFTFGAQRTPALLRDDDTRGNFRSAEFRDALAFYASLYADGLAPRVLSTELQDPIDAFGTGQFALYPNSPTLLKDLERRRLDPAVWGTARMPGPDGPGPVSSTGASLAVTRQTRRPEAALALLRFLASPAQELRLQHYIGALPARPSAWAAPVLARDPRLRPCRAQLDQPATAPPIVEWERIRIEVQLVAERLVRGQLDLAAATGLMDARVDRLLAKRRWLVERGRPA